jgi:hypothetical protein
MGTKGGLWDGRRERAERKEIHSFAGNVDIRRLQKHAWTLA